MPRTAWWLRLAVWCLVAGALGCGGSAPAAAPAPPTTSASVPAAPETAARAPSEPTANRPRIVFLGDSLTAGLGLEPSQNFPSLIQQRLDAAGYDYVVVNAGVSGDTSAGGLRRLDWSLDGDVRILVVALGANDGLRGLTPADLRKNLAAILDRARGRGITAILAGMEAPPNNGAEYTAQFRAVYRDLAAAYQVRLIPFLLDGVAGIAALNQADGIHPNTTGARMIADLVWRTLEPALTRPVTGAR